MIGWEDRMERLRGGSHVFSCMLLRKRMSQILLDLV